MTDQRSAVTCPTYCWSIGTAPFTVVNVKPERMLNKPKVIDVLKWTDRVCRERGWQYEVWSGINPTELSTVRFLSLAKRSRFVDRAASGPGPHLPPGRRAHHAASGHPAAGPGEDLIAHYPQFLA